MMYRHEIEECLERAKQERRIYQRNGKREEADHVSRRIASLERLYKQARYAYRTPLEESNAYQPK